MEQAVTNYNAQYQRSVQDRDQFWREKAVEHIDWFKPFEKTVEGDFSHAEVSWFKGGKTNICYNAIDRHVAEKGDAVAIRWEGDEPGTTRTVTYKEMQAEVSRIANVLKAQGVKKGVTVTSSLLQVSLDTMVPCLSACAHPLSDPFEEGVRRGRAVVEMAVARMNFVANPSSVENKLFPSLVAFPPHPSTAVQTVSEHRSEKKIVKRLL